MNSVGVFIGVATGLLACYWATPVGWVLLRISLIGTVIPFAASALRHTRLESGWRRVLALFGAGVLVGSVAALVATDYVGVEPADIAKDLGRQAYILLFAWLVAVVARTSARRRALSYASALAALAGATSIIVAYVDFAGFGPNGIVNATGFKQHAAEQLGLAVNPVAFGTFSAALLAYPAVAVRRGVSRVFAAYVGSAILLSASRTTQAAIVIGALLLWGLLAVQRLRARFRAVVVVSAVAGAIALMMVAGDLLALIDPSTVNVLTTNRYELWGAAIGKFWERPLVGWGAGSWRYELEHYLPGNALYGSEALVENVRSGGFHNAYLNVLAERGLVGLVPGLMMIGFIGRRSFHIFRLRRTVSGMDARLAAIAPYWFIVQTLRGLGEQPGWFGNADGLVDFVAYMGASLIVAVAASVPSPAALDVDAHGRRNVGLPTVANEGP